VTYTVVAVDRATGAMALGTVSHSTSVLAKVLARAGSSDCRALVASQAFSSPALGAACAEHAVRGLDHDRLTDLCLEDEWAAYRQVVLVTDWGELAGYTGDRCLRYAGHRVEHAAGIAVAGNMLEGEGVLTAAVDAAANTAGPVDVRVLAALEAAGAAGGDFRGDRAAGLVTHGTEAVIDIRVDDHDRPHAELRRLRDLTVARAVLPDCYGWIARGRPAAEAQLLVERLSAADATDPDVRVWQLAVAAMAGTELAPAPAPDEPSRLVAERLVERVVGAPRPDGKESVGVDIERE
jgi:uncharacterized Ntn-hydrolase superfamily protein